MRVNGYSLSLSSHVYHFYVNAPGIELAQSLLNEHIQVERVYNLMVMAMLMRVLMSMWFGFMQH